ncbi:MAG: YraN family protein [Kofleriaceae bacterium]|nr:YraN family protein [Kofleriaceae bacterium]MCL4228782.1 YraN family protein [Myxococcales bacterium]
MAAAGGRRGQQAARRADRRRQDAGERGEDLASRALAARGYRLVERNFRCRLGELDAVAYDGDTLVFIEVRSRADARFGGGLAAVGPAKQRQVARVAAAYLALRRPRFVTCRFDVVGITGDELTIVRDAFRVTW